MSFKFHGKGWRRDQDNGGEFVPLLGPNGEWIADVRQTKFAGCLVAAGDLLAACEASEKVLREWHKDNGVWREVRDQLEAAISKAKGTP